MQKHDKMVALAKEKSAEMTETAITAIETMYRKNIKISVAELTKLTGLSRGFFYNNPNVKQVMMELKEKQQGMILRNPIIGRTSSTVFPFSFDYISPVILHIFSEDFHIRFSEHYRIISVLNS